MLLYSQSYSPACGWGNRPFRFAASANALTVLSDGHHSPNSRFHDERTETGATTRCGPSTPRLCFRNLPQYISLPWLLFRNRKQIDSADLNANHNRAPSLRQLPDERNELQRLAQAHLIAENRTSSLLMLAYKPFETVNLVFAHFSADDTRWLAVDDDWIRSHNSRCSVPEFPWQRPVFRSVDRREEWCKHAIVCQHKHRTLCSCLSTLLFHHCILFSQDGDTQWTMHLVTKNANHLCTFDHCWL